VKVNAKSNFSTNEPISTNNILIDTAQQAKTKRNFKIFQNSFYGSNRGIFVKNHPFNNISTVRPIFTKTILIDSPQQGKQNECRKILAGNFCEKYPLKTFLTVQPIFKINNPIDSG
jgi:hypothetical protein